MACGSTFLMRAGGWEGGGIVAASEATARWSKTKRGINDALNTEAKRMRPIQLALLAMAQVRGRGGGPLGRRTRRKRPRSRSETPYPTPPNPPRPRPRSASPRHPATVLGPPCVLHASLVSIYPLVNSR